MGTIPRSSSDCPPRDVMDFDALAYVYVFLYLADAKDDSLVSNDDEGLMVVAHLHPPRHQPRPPDPLSSHRLRVGKRTSTRLGTQCTCSARDTSTVPPTEHGTRRYSTRSDSSTNCYVTRGTPDSSNDGTRDRTRRSRDPCDP